jgi:hypothetical protein
VKDDGMDEGAAGIGAVRLLLKERHGENEKEAGNKNAARNLCVHKDGAHDLSLNPIPN